MSIKPKSKARNLKELLGQLDRGEIKVNARYQRSGEIWPARAKSFLVETVLRGMPVPRVLLHKLSKETPPHHSDIIDGQQRCSILGEYRKDGFALSGDLDNEGLLGKVFSELPSRLRQAFDDYEVPIDEYEGVNHNQIRQVFRRLNYYTAPLNPAEQRHAQFFGELSRFVEDQCQRWRSLFENLHVFTAMQLRRRADEQLMAEIVAAMLNGVSTTTAKSLRAVYQKHERQFSSGPDFARRLDKARNRIEGWDALGRSKLRKHYHLFSLTIAVIHAETGLKSVEDYLGPKRAVRSNDEVLRAFETLDNAIRFKTERGRYAGFWIASREKTNVQVNRLKRCKYFYNALTGG